MRLENDWRDPATLDAVTALLRSGKVPPRIHTLFMNLLIRFGRSDAADLQGILPLVGAFHLKFWDLDDDGGRVSQPLHDLGSLLRRNGFTGTLTSEWGGHEWLQDDPTEMTRSHLALAGAALAEPAAVEPAQRLRAAPRPRRALTAYKKPWHRPARPAPRGRPHLSANYFVLNAASKAAAEGS